MDNSSSPEKVANLDAMLDELAPLPSDTPPEAPEQEAPQEEPSQPSIPPDEVPTPEEVTEPEAPPEKDEEEVDVPDPANQEQTTKKRLTGAIKEIEKKNDELRRALDLQIDLVQDDPDYIHKIAQHDPVMANKVIQKVWGDQGIRSYKQLKDFAKLEELKESNPDLYETKREMITVKSKLEEREEKDKSKVRSSFLKGRGIRDNEYDPNYQKIEEALELVNPEVLKDDYERGLELAYQIAFGNKKVTPQVTPSPTMKSGGAAPAPIPSRGASPDDSWLAGEMSRVSGLSIKL